MILRRLALLLLLLPGLARAASVLDVRAVPFLDEPARISYQRFLVTNLPRAVAIAPGGKIGWFGGGGTIEQARSKALASCAAKGASDCAIYAENLDVVWQGQLPAPQTVPPPLISAFSYVFAPDNRYFWRGAQAARGVYVWAHGYGGLANDARGLQPQAHVRWFNNAGFDIVRFDREPMSDDRNRAAGWLHDGLAELRRRGYRTVIVGGQSRGAWNSLQMLDTPGLADAVIAVSPAAHGQGGSTNLSAQYDDLRSMLSDVEPGRTRVAVVQFAQDPYIGDAERRFDLLRRVRPKLGALLLIDRPPGLTGHYAGSSAAFNERFGACLFRFALDPAPPDAC